jgi:hypothetical protein
LIAVLKDILDDFSLATGLKINFHKSTFVLYMSTQLRSRSRRPRLGGSPPSSPKPTLVCPCPLSNFASPTFGPSSTILIGICPGVKQRCSTRAVNSCWLTLSSAGCLSISCLHIPFRRQRSRRLMHEVELSSEQGTISALARNVR